MAAPIRVVGRIDLAQEICATLRGAGLDADLVTAGPTSVFAGTPPSDGVDVVVGTSAWDPPLWRIAKRKHPLRPMVAVMQRGREPVLRGLLTRRYGPDAFVTWPASATELSAAVRQAQASAGRRRRWGRGDAASALVWIGLAVSYLGGGRGWGGEPGFAEALVRGAGALAAGVGMLVGVRFSRYPRAQGALGLLLGALGVAAVAIAVVEWAR